jgi:hypothetical protein
MWGAPTESAPKKTKLDRTGPASSTYLLMCLFHFEQPTLLALAI